MCPAVGSLSRIVGTTGLAAVSALHGLWATGSSWPARDQQRLAECVVGAAGAMPGTIPTLLVAGGTAGAAVLCSGAAGDGRAQRLGLRTMGTVMLARAILGGDVALSVLGLPAAGGRFRRLDNRFYRPLTAVLGVSLWLAARERHGR